MNVQNVLEQGTEPPTAPRAPQHKWLPTAPGVCSRCVCVCSLLCVCTFDGINAEHKFLVWVTILGRMSRHFHKTKQNGSGYLKCILQVTFFFQMNI